MRTKKLSGLVTLSAVFAFILAGCGENTAQSNPVEASPPPRVVTAEDWSRALHSVYEKQGESKADADGNVSYEATIDSLKVKVEHDPLKRVTNFTLEASYRTRDVGITLRDSTVIGYISVKDCSLPELRLNPVYVARRGYLFMNKISILADGELVFEQEIPFEHVTQEANNEKVIEWVEFTIAPSKYDGLRKIAESRSVVARMQGRSKYITVPSESRIRYEFGHTLTIFDKLYAALKDNIPAKCS